MDDEDPLNVEAALYLAAASIRRRFHEYISHEDLVQEGWLWFHEHPRQVQTLRDMDNPRTAQFFLQLDFQRVMGILARKEKAATLGYDPEDEQFYAIAMIRELLGPAVIGDMQPALDTDRVSGSADPAEHGGYHAMLMDVKQAWDSTPLSQADRDVVWRVLVDGWSEVAVAGDLGVSRQAVQQRLKRALRKLSEALGGARPHPCGPTCECVEARLRRRPGVHSSVSGVNQLTR
jgi:DNA-directed RNA polymerase specialized sigma24 family protein